VAQVGAVHLGSNASPNRLSLKEDMPSIHAAPAREAALDILTRVEDGAFSHLALSGMLRRLEPKDRGLTTELVYGTLTYQLRLDRMLARFSSRDKTAPGLLRVLRLAAYQLMFLDKIPAHAILNDAVTQAKRIAGPKAGGFVNAVLRRLSAKPAENLPAGDSAEALSLRYSMPLWLVKRRLKQTSASDVEAWLTAENAPAPLTVRILTEALSMQEATRSFPEGAAEPGALSPTALRLHMPDPFAHEMFTAGRCVVQDEGSQAVVLAADVGRGARVLDLCAGFGGKTLFLAEQVGAAGQVLSVDLSEKKLQSLQKEAQRLGLEARIQTRAADAASLTAEEIGRFSCVLLDAPCSGLGTLRRHPELRWRRSLEDITRCAELQQRLLRAATSLLAPGGALLYSVCSPEPEEGEQQIAHFLRDNPGFAPSPITTPSLQSAITASGAVKTLPHRHNADAFFIAKICKRVD
jgi:16S rRNA (cytosine967-C5)-methyltransferase